MPDIDSVLEEQPVTSAEEKIAELEATLASLREDSEVAYVLLGLAGALADVRSVEETFKLAVRTIPELFGANNALAAEWDPSSDSFEITAHWGMTDDEARHKQEAATEASTNFPFLKQAVTERRPVFASDEPPHEGLSVMAIPLIRWGKDFGGLRLEFDGPRTFSPRDIALAQGVARQLGVALDNARRFNLLQGLRRFGENVASKLRQKDVLEEVLIGASDLLNAEGAWLYFLDGSHASLNSYGGRGDGIALPERLARLSLNEDPWSELTRGETVGLPDVGSYFGRPDLTGLVAPLRPGAGRMIGCLLVVYEQGHPFGAEDVEALNVLVAQSSQAIENARRFDRERSVARSLQAGLLNTTMPEIAGFEAGAVYEAADEEAEVGGDFYDLLELPDGRVGIVVGDVSGKGAVAAAQMAMVKYMLRAFAIRNPMPGSVLYHLNNALVRELPEDRFTTLFYGVLDPAERTCSISLAGHPTPLLYRVADGTVEAVRPTGTILGAFEDQSFGHVTMEMHPGDVLIAYTDGLLEARKGDDLYGRTRIEESLKKRAPGGQASVLARSMYEDARSFGKVTDDTVVLALTCREPGR
jgi:serine phosphatase RsbU (regulator of sigma subunit)